MFEGMTYENILTDMLNRVNEDVDKREGSIIYDAIAPCAYKLAEHYFLLNGYIDLVFADTAVDTYLDRRTGEIGIERKPATKAVRLIETTAPVYIGTRWGIEDLIYIIKERITDTRYKAECEMEGVVGNLYSGKMENLDNIPGVTAQMTDILESGFNVESDDSLRSRHFIKARQPATSGNVYHYTQWAMDVPGVGGVKLFPLDGGPGTVKILIVNSDMEVDETLETKVYDYIESVRPIGATVTVDSPVKETINISADVVLDGSKSMESVQVDFTSLVGEMLKETVFSTYSISYAKIGGVLLSTPGVEDYSNLRLNGASSNITIDSEGIPILGEVSLSEVV